MISRESCTASGVIRAPRFPVQMIIRLRSVHETAWHEGLTENVSRSGILLRCDLALAPDTRVEVGLVLPVEAPGRPVAEVECRGFVARVDPPTDEGAESRLAVSISDYRFVRERVDARP